tara:strand:- start:5914 stop:6222 length:309 start_codon:yes stop_codon:yes gene_type:complete
MRNRLAFITKIKKNSKKIYKPLRYPNIPLSISDLYVITTSGDRLDLLANQFYNDIRLWWIISMANRDVLRRDSYALKPGLEIRIPQNITPILENFEKINTSY